MRAALGAAANYVAPEPEPQPVAPKVYKDVGTINKDSLLWHVWLGLVNAQGGGKPVGLFDLALWYRKKASPTAISARIRELRNDYGLTITRVAVKGTRQPLYKLESQ